MRGELEQRLLKEFPELFRGNDKPPTESLMCFGCECDDGWFDIIYEACRAIANHVKHRPECGPVEFSQIKEKFGGLRLYHYGGDEYVAGICHMAEAMSYHVCEISGERGELCKAGIWLRTLSPTLAAKYDYVPCSKKDANSDAGEEAESATNEQKND